MTPRVVRQTVQALVRSSGLISLLDTTGRFFFMAGLMQLVGTYTRSSGSSLSVLRQKC